ncbi:MAG: neuraminidase-like domain-containing protein, partial [Blastocatellia bacterium]
LIAYILDRLGSNPLTSHIDTADKLFEFFLMDVQMEPCMQTSRIRHALSSVQLFIERCRMNLEPRVSPASIKAKQWEWMKRYRVWEANRKVFLYPENWLEPELRDDQSPFFKETMSELLQSDITEEKAAVALLNYLAKLEEVAKLEPCGIHYVENDPGAADDIAHVVARSTGANRKYFYRRREYGYWTPWEHIKLDIGDNPVIPVVWNGRLFLFWLRILKQSPLQSSDMSTSSSAPPDPVASLNLSTIKTDAKSSAQNTTRVTAQAILCWSEYYNGKWQPARTSDVDRPLELGKFDSFGAGAFDRSQLKLSVMFWTKGAIRIIVSNAIGLGGSSFFLHNAFSAPELRAVKKERHFAPKRTTETSTSALKVSYDNASHSVLNNGVGDRTIEPAHPIIGNPWDTPFFYEDSRHVFYVTTAERLVTVPQWNDFGVVVTPPLKALDIPPLVFQPVETIPDLIGPVSKQPGFGVIDPVPMERFVTEDAYISRGIGTFGTVRFGDKEIGPAGSVMKSVQKR